MGDQLIDWLQYPKIGNKSSKYPLLQLTERIQNNRKEGLYHAYNHPNLIEPFFVGKGYSNIKSKWKNHNWVWSTKGRQTWDWLDYLILGNPARNSTTYSILHWYLWSSKESFSWEINISNAPFITATYNLRFPFMFNPLAIYINYHNSVDKQNSTIIRIT